MKPKVSVVIPVYNVEQYLRECLDSVVGQSLKDIEIICVNDGSTDGSLDILKEYASQDDRIAVIDKANAGYGAAMNDGLRAASGEYVAFLESDDAIVPHAYERLSDLADAHGVDIIKGNYYNLIGSGSDRELEEKPLTSIKERYGKSFRPLSEKWSFYIPMMNCLGLFRLSFLRRNAILHNETPGAAHQDMGFWFQTLCCADSMCLVDEPFYMYRQDNANSSMKDDTTAMLTLGEYDSMLDFLGRRCSLMEEALDVYSHRKYGSCMFAYSTSELSLKLPFLRALSESYAEEKRAGHLALSRFSVSEKEGLNWILEDPDAYYLSSLKQECEVSRKALGVLKSEIVRLNCVIENQRKGLEGTSSRALDSDDADSNPLVSVVIPVYNAGPYLEKCLDSVLGQACGSLEVICVDDGSTDDSAEILARYKERDSRIVVLSQENCGQSVARNKGLAVARGKYIQFVDSDDELAPGALKDLCWRMQADELDMLFFDGDVLLDTFAGLGESGRLRNPYARKRSYGNAISGADMLVRMSKDDVYRVSPCMVMLDRRYLSSIRASFPEYMVFEDNVFMARTLISASRVSHVNERYYLRRFRDGSTTTSEITAYHVQSYFRAYLELLKFSEERSMSVEVADALAKEMKAILKTTKRYLSGLSAIQRELAYSMSPVKKGLFGELMGREDSSSTSRGVVRANSKEIERIKASNSWRIGRAVTFAPRLLKRALKKAKKARR